MTFKLRWNGVKERLKKRVPFQYLTIQAYFYYPYYNVDLVYKRKHYSKDRGLYYKEVRTPITVITASGTIARFNKKLPKNKYLMANYPVQYNRAMRVYNFIYREIYLNRGDND